MKKYIFSTASIQEMGGMQTYVAGKAGYLEKNGWKVYALCASYSDEPSFQIPYLSKYKDGIIDEMKAPVYYYSRKKQKSIIEHIKSIIEYSEKDSIIIESHDSTTAIWGEFVASETNAKHVVFLLNETFNDKCKYYQEADSFFGFKLDRRELMGRKGVYQLFGERRGINYTDIVPISLDESPVQDIDNEKVNKIEKAEWNICYIGRADKGYVPKIVSDVGKFANMHKDRKIQFIFVGNTHVIDEQIDRELSIIDNLSVNKLGNMFPIPRKLFKKVDVVIAGSGSARCAAYEKVTTIVADAVNYLASGILGYNTKESVYHDENVIQQNYEDALEDVLVRKIQEKMEFDYPHVGIEQCCNQNFELINASDMTREYFNIKSIHVDYKNDIHMKVYLAARFPKMTNVLRRIRHKLRK